MFYSRCLPWHHPYCFNLLLQLTEKPKIASHLTYKINEIFHPLSKQVTKCSSPSSPWTSIVSLTASSNEWATKGVGDNNIFHKITHLTPIHMIKPSKKGMQTLPSRNKKDESLTDSDRGGERSCWPFRNSSNSCSLMLMWSDGQKPPSQWIMWRHLPPLEKASSSFP